MDFLFYIYIHLGRAKIWKESSFFIAILNTIVNLNTNKMVFRIAELHDDFNDTILMPLKINYVLVIHLKVLYISFSFIE